MEQREQDDRAGCNTIRRPPEKKTRMYLLTINNPTEEEVDTIEELHDDDLVVDLIGQYEKGEKEGTLHIQLLINWKNPRTFNGVKKLFPRAHIEPAKHLVKAAKYCWKDDTRVEDKPTWRKIGSKSLEREWHKRTREQEQEEVSHKIVVKGTKDPLEGKELKWWQEEILELYETEPDERKIYWYYDEEGGVGKTSFTKSLYIRYDDVLLCTGSVRDSKYVVAQWIMANEKKRHPRMIIYDIARSQDSEKISYQGLEELKNGIFTNTKYESSGIAYNCPHMIIFSNRPPDEDKISPDRWVIKNIDDYGGYLPEVSSDEWREIYME